MRKASELVGLTTRTQAGSTEDSRETAALVNQIFRRLVVLSTAWKQAVEGDPSAYQAEYKRQLLAALRREGVTEWSQVERGLAMHSGDFLPNPNRFAQNCAVDADALHRSAAYRPFVALPSPPGDAQTAASALAGMRASLRA